ncbi:hypothetical protein [Lentzea flava]|uniref:Uncharacterized protein n=1 Tax=Lentzea flava TaxID=103732 RepID=A0ABQ2ULC1_9PSEU|nr:hypothetical protein [Lentzea flava]MCP2199961.1 hypothetical protein [Lentzea flava]GGU39675.1 hypothetical protein GCM10010178_35000 [Lentzea flava]
MDQPVATKPGLAERAVRAARTQRVCQSFQRRHDSPEQWNRWTRHARVARTAAAALQVPLDAVTVLDDPFRPYNTRDAGQVPGDLIVVTDPDTQDRWAFIPDLSAPGEAWLLLDRCPGCNGEVPVARIAILADLGDYLEPGGYVWPIGDARHDPAHQHDCTFTARDHD